MTEKGPSDLQGVDSDVDFSLVTNEDESGPSLLEKFPTCGPIDPKDGIEEIQNFIMNSSEAWKTLLNETPNAYSKILLP